MYGLEVCRSLNMPTAFIERALHSHPRHQSAVAPSTLSQPRSRHRPRSSSACARGARRSPRPRRTTSFRNTARTTTASSSPSTAPSTRTTPPTSWRCARRATWRCTTKGQNERPREYRDVLHLGRRRQTAFFYAFIFAWFSSLRNMKECESIYIRIATQRM